eukprot:m51a1_g2323 hypothetical protein (304) ;mRNA; r:503103-504106
MSEDSSEQSGVAGKLKNLEAMGFVHLMPGMAPPRRKASEEQAQAEAEPQEAAAPLAHVQRRAGPRRAHKPTGHAGAAAAAPEGEGSEGEADEAQRLRAEAAALEGRLAEAQGRAAGLEARVAELEQQLGEQQRQHEQQREEQQQQQRQETAKLEARVAELELQLREQEQRQQQQEQQHEQQQSAQLEARVAELEQKQQQQQQQQQQGGSCRLTCYAGTNVGDTICVAGSSAALGSWEPRRTPMRYVAFEASRGLHAWEFAVAADAPAEFKFVWMRPGGVQWEAGPNRQLDVGLREISDTFRFN